MRATMQVAWAFLVRDASVAASYPLASVLRLGGMVSGVLLLYLPARLIGQQDALQRYGGFLPFSVVGMALMNFFMANYSAFSSAIRLEQTTGTLEAVLMTPARIPSLVVGASLWNFCLATISTVLFIGAGGWIYGFSLRGSWPAAIFVTGLTTLVFACLGILSASFIMVFKRGDPLKVIVSGVFFLLGGVIYPVGLFPEWLRPVSWVLPITHGAHALRAMLLEGASLSSVASHVLVLVVYCVVALPLSLAAFRWAIRRAKRDGTLLQY